VLYLGGKGRLGPTIAKVILKATSERGVYFEPFLGGGSAFKHIAPHFGSVHVGDVHEDLVLMWRAAAEGWTPPSVVSELEYQKIRREPASALRGFIGFGCSFGGKWWGGYARSRCNGDDYYARHAYNSVNEIARLLPPHVEGTLRHRSFEDWTPFITTSAVVYADPPYARTTGYKAKFDSSVFWSVMRNWSDMGARVFVSEYEAPAGWSSIWSKEQRRKVSGGTGEMTKEHIFTRSRRG
jgi:DNA adenine methylase